MVDWSGKSLLRCRVEWKPTLRLPSACCDVIKALNYWDDCRLRRYTGLWLAESDHMTQLLASHWTRESMREMLLSTWRKTVQSLINRDKFLKFIDRRHWSHCLHFFIIPHRKFNLIHSHSESKLSSLSINAGVGVTWSHSPSPPFTLIVILRRRELHKIFSIQ